MSFFAVEVDYYRAGGEDEARVLVPRTAFVPSWVKEPGAHTRTTVARSLVERLASAPAGTQELIQRLDEVAAELGVEAVDVRTGRSYRPLRQQLWHRRTQE